MTGRWPGTQGELVALQADLADAARAVPPWELPAGAAPLVVGGCFVAFARGGVGAGRPGEAAWAAAVAWPLPPVAPRSRVRRTADAALKGSGPGLPRRARDVVGQSVVAGTVTAPYRPGLLALREGRLLEAAVRSLRRPPDVLLVDATGRDHPRGAGLAVQLGAVLDLPTVGVTHRPLRASGDPPTLRRGASSPLVLDGATVAFWVCTRSGARPVVAHAGWRTSPAAAAAVVLACSSEAARTPIPLVEARRAAREARAVAEGRVL